MSCSGSFLYLPGDNLSGPALLGAPLKVLVFTDSTREARTQGCLFKEKDVWPVFHKEGWELRGLTAYMTTVLSVGPSHIWIPRLPQPGAEAANSRDDLYRHRITRIACL